MPDERSDDGLSVLSLITTDGLTVPHVWPVEVENLLLKAVRQKRIDGSARRCARVELAKLLTAVDAAEPLAAAAAASALAERHRLSVHDASYLALAIRSDATLASFDKALRKAAAAEGVPLLPT